MTKIMACHSFLAKITNLELSKSFLTDCDLQISSENLGSRQKLLKKIAKLKSNLAEFFCTHTHPHTRVHRAESCFREFFALCQFDCNNLDGGRGGGGHCQPGHLHRLHQSSHCTFSILHVKFL